MSNTRAFFVTLVAHFVLSTTAQWIKVTNPALPNANADMAVGEYNNKITLLGGNNECFDVTLYDIDDNSFTKTDDALLTDRSSFVYGKSQYYSQSNNIIYMIDYYGTFINTYNLETEQFSENALNQDMPQLVEEFGCLVSTIDALYVVGGWDSIQDKTVGDLQIFSFSTNSWRTSSTYALSSPRYKHSCAIASNKLYAIGGTDTVEYHYSIEYISIINIDANIWKYTKDGLNDNYIQAWTRAIEYNRLIYIIGNLGYSKAVQIIDTTTDTVSTASDELKYPGTGMAPIIIGQILYVFGGYDVDKYITEWQYYQLPATTEPTASPTDIASTTSTTSTTITTSPTDTATNKPTTTSSPTAIPTNAPTTKHSTVSPITPQTTIEAIITNGPTYTQIADPTTTTSITITTLSQSTFTDEEATSSSTETKEIYTSTQATSSTTIRTTTRDSHSSIKSVTIRTTSNNMEGEVNEETGDKADDSNDDDTIAINNDDPYLQYIVMFGACVVILCLCGCILYVYYRYFCKKHPAEVHQNTNAKIIQTAHVNDLLKVQTMQQNVVLEADDDASAFGNMLTDNVFVSNMMMEDIVDNMRDEANGNITPGAPATDDECDPNGEDSGFEGESDDTAIEENIVSYMKTKQ